MSERLGVIEFSKQLIETEDLDPVYVAMYKANLTRAEVSRFIIGWMCFYHTGIACMLAKAPRFFDMMCHITRGGKEYPRGSQRVHHRGPPAIASTEFLQENFKSAEELLSWCISDGLAAKVVFNKVCELVGFGPCFAWRIPDIQEAIGLEPVQFVDRDVDLFYGNPKRGAEICCEEHGLGKKDVVMKAHLYVMNHLGHMKAPPMYRRPINVQETETIFCKWKSHIVGRYEVGRDTARARSQFSFYKLGMCQRVLDCMPEGVPQ